MTIFPQDYAFELLVVAALLANGWLKKIGGHLPKRCPRCGLRL
jgi:hypothetical protein